MKPLPDLVDTTPADDFPIDWDDPYAYVDEAPVAELELRARSGVVAAHRLDHAPAVGLKEPMVKLLAARDRRTPTKEAKRWVVSREVVAPVTPYYRLVPIDAPRGVRYTRPAELAPRPPRRASRTPTPGWYDVVTTESGELTVAPAGTWPGPYDIVLNIPFH